MTQENLLGIEHYIYTGQQYRGNKLHEYGKCLCGAVLQGRDQIDAHQQQHPAQKPGPT